MRSENKAAEADECALRRLFYRCRNKIAQNAKCSARGRVSLGGSSYSNLESCLVLVRKAFGSLLATTLGILAEEMQYRGLVTQR